MKLKKVRTRTQNISRKCQDHNIYKPEKAGLLEITVVLKSNPPSKKKTYGLSWGGEQVASIL